jgi:hypothetical protein
VRNYPFRLFRVVLYTCTLPNPSQPLAHARRTHLCDHGVLYRHTARLALQAAVKGCLSSVPVVRSEAILAGRKKQTRICFETSSPAMSYNTRKKVQPVKVFCICRTADDDRPMIMCDACEEWFHFDCLHINPDSVNTDAPFFCSTCLAKPEHRSFASASQSSTPMTIGAASTPRSHSRGNASSLPQQLGQSPSLGIKKPAKKKNKVPGDQSTSRIVADADAAVDEDDARSYSSSFDTSYKMFERLVIGSPVHALATQASDRTRRPRGSSLSLTPKSKGKRLCPF